MTLNTRQYVSPEGFASLKEARRRGKKRQLGVPSLWLTAQQAKELGYNQGEEDFELTPAEVEAGNVFGKIAQTPIEQPQELKPIASEAGGNLRNLLLRLYPEKISGALAGGTKVDQLEDFFSKDVQNQIQTNPEQFIQQLASKRMPIETRALLNYLNVPADVTDQIVGVQDTEIQVNRTLNAIPEFAGIDVEGLTNLIETKPDEFFELIRTGGITPEKKKLLETIGFSDEEIRTLLRIPYATGTALDKGQLAIEAEIREREQRVQAGKQGKFGRLFTAGVGDLVANVGGVFRWAGAEGIGDKISQAGQFMQVQAQPMEKGEFKWQGLFDPTSYSFQSTLAGLVRTTPTLMTLAIPGIGAFGLAGSIAGRLGLGAFKRAIITGIGGSALSRPMESAMEAAGSYDEARARGLSHEEAVKAANSVFKKNLTLVGTDIIQLTAAFAPTPFGKAGSIIQRGLVKTAQVGGKLAITGLTEGGEEVYQDLLQRQARGEKFKMDADAQQVFAIGAIMGLGMGGGGDILMRVTDKVSTGFNPQQKAQFDGDVRKNQAKGLDETQAKVQAMDKVVENNPDVAKNVETATQEVNQELTQEQLDKIQAKPAPTATTEGVVTVEKVTPAPEVTKAISMLEDVISSTSRTSFHGQRITSDLGEGIRALKAGDIEGGIGVIKDQLVRRGISKTNTEKLNRILSALQRTPIPTQRIIPIRKLEVGSTAELGIEQGKPFTDDFGYTWIMGKEAGTNQFKLDTVVQGQQISIWARKQSGWQVNRNDTLSKLKRMEAIPKAEVVPEAVVPEKPVRLTHPRQKLSAQELLDSGLRTGSLPEQAFSGEVMSRLRKEEVIRKIAPGMLTVDKPWKLKEIVAEFQVKYGIRPEAPAVAEVKAQQAELFQEAVSQGIPPSKAPPPAAQTITTPTSLLEPARDSEIRRIITQSEEQVRQDQPKAITNLLRKIPGAKQLLEVERPGLKMTGENQKVLVAIVAEQAARSDVSVWAMGTRLKLLSDIREVFGKDVLRGAKAENIKIVNGRYVLTSEQERVLADIEIHNDTMLDWVTSNYGAEIGRYTHGGEHIITDLANPITGTLKDIADSRGIYLPNVDKPTEGVVDYLIKETRAVSQGRGKTRIWQTARDRMGGKTAFDPELDVQKLLEGLDDFKASAAAGQTYKTAIGGLTRLEAMETTHPELFAKMTALRKELNSLKGSAGTIESNIHTAIDDFMKSSVEDTDLLNLKDNLDVRLKAGKRKGLDMTAIQDRITAVQDQIDEIRPAWQAANLKPYVFIQQGLYRYFPADQAKLILESLATTNNRLLGFIEKWRGQAFSGDFSPFTIQGVIGVLADPWGSLKAGVGGVKAAVQHRDLLRSVRIEALADDIANNPVEWGEFASLMGRTLTGVPREYAAGFLSKIPGFDKFTENTFVTVTRGSFNLWQRNYKNMVKHGVPILEAKVAAADIASKVYPLVSQTRLGQSQARHAVLRALPTSYSFIRQPITLTLDALRGLTKLATLQKLTPAESMAVKVAVTGAASTLAVSATSAFISALALGKDDDEAWQAALDAINPHPMNGKFASIIIGNVRIPLGGPYRALFRAMYPAQVKGVPFPVPFAGLANYARNRITPAIRTQLDLAPAIIGKPEAAVDYNKVQIFNTKDGTVFENILRFLEYEFENFLPLTAGEVFEHFRQGEKAREPLLQEVIGQFVGVNPVTLDNTYIDRQIKQLGLEKQGEAKPYTIQKPEVYNTKDLWGDVSSVLRKRMGEGFKDKPLTLAIKSAMTIKDTSDSFLNAKLTSLTDDQWELLQQRQDLTDTTEFDKTNPLLSKVSQRDYLLLREYKSLTDKKEQVAFLKDHPELSLNPRQDWLKSHPKENAQLALFGQAKVLTKEAYNEVLRMAKELDIPDSAIPDLNIPKDSVDNYFEYQDMVSEDKNSSWEAQLMLAKDDKLREFLGLKPIDTPIASLELKVKNRANFDKLSGFSDEDSPDYIADDKKRAEAVKKFKADNPAFVDDTRMIEAIEKGTGETPTPDNLIKFHVDYGKLQDKEGVGSSSAEVMLYRVDNPEYDQWRQDTVIWGDNALKPVDQAKIPIWRIDVKYSKEDIEYGTIKETSIVAQTKLRNDYLLEHSDYATARRQREAYQKGLTGGMVKTYTDYYSLAEKGYRRERFLMDNSDFALAVGLSVPLRVPSEQYDVISEKYETEDEEYEAILKQYDRTQMAEQKQAIEDYLNKNPKYANDRLRRDAYGLYVPDNLIEHYVLYKELPSGQYQKDWFMMENQDFYRTVYLGILENERLDFRKTPTREVYAKYQQYQDMPSRMKEDYRFDNPDLEDWLILTGKVSGKVSEARRKAALTPREKFGEYLYGRQSEFEKKLAEVKGR